MLPQSSIWATSRGRSARLQRGPRVLRLELPQARISPDALTLPQPLLGLEVDRRRYDQCAEVLLDLGLRRVRVMTNNPLNSGA